MNVVNFEDFDEDKFGKNKDELTIVCVATHYEGDPCDNTKRFFNWVKRLKKNRDRTVFSDMGFTVFALGDTSYNLYNTVGLFFDKAFEELGGTRIYEKGEADHCNYKSEDHFDAWKENLWHQICDHYMMMNPKKEIKKKAAKGQVAELPLKMTYLDGNDNVN